MPIVNGRHYPYTPEGMAKAMKAKKKKMSGKNYSKDHDKSYSSEHVKMARRMM